MARARRDYPAARSRYEATLALWREAGDRRGIALALASLGGVAGDQGEAETARALHEESLALRREAGDRRGIAQSLTYLGMLAYARGDYPEAAALQEESLALNRELRDVGGAASALLMLGQTAGRRGDLRRAMTLSGESLDLFREVGNRLGVAMAQRAVGQAALDAGDRQQAEAMLLASLDTARALQDPWAEAAALVGLANVARDGGDLAGAELLAREGLALAWPLGTRRQVALALETLAGAARPPAGAPGAPPASSAPAAALRELLGMPPPAAGAPPTTSTWPGRGPPLAPPRSPPTSPPAGPCRSTGRWRRPPGTARPPARRPDHPAVAAEIVARAPGKLILFGEHAVNRGQPALSVSAGLYATCRLRPDAGPGIVFEFGRPGAGPRADHPRGGARSGAGGRRLPRSRGRRLDPGPAAGGLLRPPEVHPGHRSRRRPAAEPDRRLPQRGPPHRWTGLGGGRLRRPGDGSGRPRRRRPDRARVADWAHRGDVVAHGGVASRLDTQTSLTGGVVRFAVAAGLAEPVAVHPGLRLVIGDTGVRAATAEVNGRVRRWLAECPAARMRYFECVGALSRAALAPLAAGDWPALGRLMTLNQMVLEKIGVSSSGAGAADRGRARRRGERRQAGRFRRGGIMIALAGPEAGAGDALAAAIAAAGGRPLTPALAVPGAGLVAADPEGGVP